jgi:gluconokinase
VFDLRKLRKCIMSDQRAILALDIGTSSTRAILYDSSGTPVPGVAAQLPYTLTTSSEGEASVDADFLVGLVARTIDTVLQKASILGRQISAVALSTFWHTLVPVDTSGTPLLRLMTWEDTRPREAARELAACLDAAAIHMRTGTRLHASYWPAKIYWLTSRQPELAQRVARYLSFGEYLQERFLGRSICSLSMASGTGLLNTHTQSWDQTLLDFLHLSPTSFSELGDLSDTLQGLTSEFSRRWPALQSVPWFPAIGDGAAANIGSNCTDTTRWAVTIGTSSAMRVVVAPEQVTPGDGLWLYFIDKRRTLLGGALSEGGNVFAWLKQTLRLPELNELNAQIAQLKPADHGLTVLPMLAGERSPGWHAQASMTITGLSIHNTPAEIVQAVLEAVIFQLSCIHDQIAQALAPQVAQPKLVASGGALRQSPLLCQILADTLNLPLELSNEHEASARGVALLALEALHIMPDLTRPLPLSPVSIQPDSTRHGIYQRARERQQRLYQLLLDEQTCID